MVKRVALRGDSFHSRCNHFVISLSCSSTCTLLLRLAGQVPRRSFICFSTSICPVRFVRFFLQALVTRSPAMSGRRPGAGNAPTRYTTLGPSTPRTKPSPVPPIPSSQAVYNQNGLNYRPQIESRLAAVQSVIDFNFAGRGAFRTQSPRYAPSIRSIDSFATAVRVMRSKWASQTYSTFLGIFVIYFESSLPARGFREGRLDLQHLSSEAKLIHCSLITWTSTRRSC